MTGGGILDTIGNALHFTSGGSIMSNFLSSFTVANVMPFAIRFGSIVTILITIGGALLYIKQDNLLVRFVFSLLWCFYICFLFSASTEG